MIALALSLLCSEPVFPHVASESLAGTDVAIPEGLPGTTRVLLVAFKRDDADALAARFAALRALAASTPGLYVVQTPVIGDVNRVLRAIIFQAQKGAVDEKARERFIPLFVAPDTVKRPLALKDDGMVAVIVAK